jgi:hypothetical protein
VALNSLIPSSLLWWFVQAHLVCTDLVCASNRNFSVFHPQISLVIPVHEIFFLSHCSVLFLTILSSLQPLPPDGSAKLPVTLAGAGVSNCLPATLTNPLDVVKIRSSCMEKD